MTLELQPHKTHEHDTGAAAYDTGAAAAWWSWELPHKTQEQHMQGLLSDMTSEQCRQVLLSRKASEHFRRVLLSRMTWVIHMQVLPW